MINAQLLLAAMNNYASPIYVNFPNIYKTVVYNIQNKENDVSSSRKEVVKMERCWFVHNVKLLILIFLTSTHFFLKLFVNSLI